MDQIASSPNDTLHITVSIYSMLTACNGNVLHMFYGNFSLFYDHVFELRVKGYNDFFHYDLCLVTSGRGDQDKKDILCCVGLSL